MQNLSLQTDSTDLLGGYRPLEIKHLARPLYEEFLDLFTSDFSRKQNETFLTFVSTAFQKREFKKLSQCCIRASKMGLAKMKSTPNTSSILRWEKFAVSAEKFEVSEREYI